jgi:hypothetical protein
MVVRWYGADALRSRTRNTCLEHNITTCNAIPGGLISPVSVVQVHAVASLTGHTLCHSTPALVSTGHVHPHTSLEEGTVVGMLGPSTLEAVDGTEVVPDGSLVGLEIVFGLQDAGWSDLVVRQVADLDRGACTSLGHGVGR